MGQSFSCLFVYVRAKIHFNRHYIMYVVLLYGVFSIIDFKTLDFTRISNVYGKQYRVI